MDSYKKPQDPYGFRSFHQFNKLTPALLIHLSSHSQTAADVFMLLVSCSNGMGACIVSRSSIAKFIGKSVRTVARAINYLAVHNYIAVAHSGRTNAYVLNYNMVWSNYNSKKHGLMKYIQFPTEMNIINNKQNKGFFKKLNDFVHGQVSKTIDTNNLTFRKVKAEKNPNHSNYMKREARLKRRLIEAKNDNTKLKQLVGLDKKNKKLNYNKH